MKISYQKQQNKKKENNYLKKGFLKHFIYIYISCKVFERSNETPNTKKGGSEGAFGLKNYIIDN